MGQTGPILWVWRMIAAQLQFKSRAQGTAHGTDGKEETRSPMPEHSFAKDFNYLWPFMDKLEAHGKNLPAEKRERFTGVVKVARAQFREMLALLEGTSPATAKENVDDAEPDAPSTQAAEESNSALTVGSLIPR